MRQQCLDLMARRAEEYLRRVAPGALALLNRRSLSLYGRKFSNLLVDDPVTAYKLVTSSLGYDGGKIFYRSLVRTVLGDYELASRLVDAVSRGDGEAAKRVIDEACIRIRGRM